MLRRSGKLIEYFMHVVVSTWLRCIIFLGNAWEETFCPLSSDRTQPRPLVSLAAEEEGVVFQSLLLLLPFFLYFSLLLNSCSPASFEALPTFLEILRYTNLFESSIYLSLLANYFGSTGLFDKDMYITE